MCRYTSHLSLCCQSFSRLLFRYVFNMLPMSCVADPSLGCCLGTFFVCFLSDSVYTGCWHTDVYTLRLLNYPFLALISGSLSCLTCSYSASPQCISSVLLYRQLHCPWYLRLVLPLFTLAHPTNLLPVSWLHLPSGLPPTLPLPPSLCPDI